jgi:STE24 endopeptidase
MKTKQLLLLLFLLLIPPSLFAREEVHPVDVQKAAVAAKIQDPQQATHAYLDAVPADRRAKTKAYAHGNYVLSIVDTVYTVIIFIALLGLGISRRMRDAARSITRFRPLQNAIYWIQFLIVVTLLSFPLSVYTSYHREKLYGLLSQTFGGWLKDQAIGLVVGCLLGALLIMFLYGVLRRTPRTWWIWGSVVMIVFAIFTVAIAPVFIQPLFNKFTPLPVSDIRTKILNMAHAHGIRASEVYVMDASRRTDRISAYVNGVLGTTRIVMFDNTLRRCTPEEIQMIMGHEMGHFVLNHVWKGIAFFSVIILLGFLFLRWGFAYSLRRWPGLGIESVSDVAGLPLLALLLTVFFFVTGPILNSYSRFQEDQADDFGLEASHQPDAAATTFLKLGEYRELDPNPTIEVLFFDHPSGRSRILNAMEWKQRNH